MFNHSYGLYADVWAAWAELLINLSITLFMGIHYGIIGILLGKIVSVGIIVTLWKPYYLFSQGIKLPIKLYWYGTIKYHIIIVFSFSTTLLWSDMLPFSPEKSFIHFVLFAITNLIVFCVLLTIGFYFFTPGTKALFQRFKLRK